MRPFPCGSATPEFIHLQFAVPVRAVAVWRPPFVLCSASSQLSPARCPIAAIIVVGLTPYRRVCYDPEEFLKTLLTFTVRVTAGTSLGGSVTGKTPSLERNRPAKVAARAARGREERACGGSEARPEISFRLQRFNLPGPATRNDRPRSSRSAPRPRISRSAFFVDPDFETSSQPRVPTRGDVLS